MMRLAAFIRANTQPIVEGWESFAETLVPAAEGMSPLALRNHIRQMLEFFANDIETSQTSAEQTKKSHGKKSKNVTYSAAETHASLRHDGGFNMDQMVSEYRALRASVIKLWSAQLKEPTAKDISDLTRFNESIDQALSESITHYTMKLDLSRNLFLGILSHDLQNPLSAARLSAELTLKIGAANLDKRQTMLISQVVECAARATEIVDHLLDLTRARLGSGLPIIKAKMDLGFVSRKMIDEMRVLHPDHIFTLDVSGDTQGEWDKARLAQVFSNLLGNAVQYGFTDASIDVVVAANSKEMTISVHNDGVPIPAGALGRIFDSLTRGKTEDSKAEPGSTNLGLGLYISKEIIVAHSGTMTVTSTEKDGTMFTARFPR